MEGPEPGWTVRLNAEENADTKVRGGGVDERKRHIPAQRKTLRIIRGAPRKGGLEVRSKEEGSGSGSQGGGRKPQKLGNPTGGQITKGFAIQGAKSCRLSWAVKILETEAAGLDLGFPLKPSGATNGKGEWDLRQGESANHEDFDTPEGR